MKNRNESRVLREERAALANQMSELATGGLKTPEDRTKFDALDAAQKELKARIDRIEAAGALDDEQRAGTGAPPAGVLGGADDPNVAAEQEKKYRNAFNNYLKYGSKEEGGVVGVMPEEERRMLLKRRAEPERRDMGTGSQGAYPGATTGFFVPVGFVDRVTEALKYYGPMLDGGRDPK